MYSKGFQLPTPLGFSTHTHTQKIHSQRAISNQSNILELNITYQKQKSVSLTFHILLHFPYPMKCKNDLIFSVGILHLDLEKSL